MKQQILVSSILMGLAATLWLNPAHAQSTPDATSDQSKKADVQRLDVVPVTGSLIPQAQVETASPTITITSQQLERQGFGSVYDALRAQPVATGAVQDNQFQGGFTGGAKPISLLGLDPGFTLVLINGHPLADYPLLYNGASNFVDLSDIPVGMVDRIDILPGNQSSIYGSSAIAGVINIILKDKIDGYELNLRAGGYSGGGGQNQRLEFLGGHSFGDLDVTFGLQLSKQDPIWGYDRDLTKSVLANPNPNLHYGSRTFLSEYLDLSTGAVKYNDPGADACGPVSSLYGGTTDYETRPGRGNYCGSKYVNGYSTILNQDKSGTGYLNLKYKLNDSAELYANVLYNETKQSFSSGPYFWESSIDTGGFYYNDQTPGTLQLFQHIFAPEEIGSSALYSEHQLDKTYNAWGGIRGTVGNSNNWDYDIYYARSQSNLSDKQYWPLKDQVNSFFENQFLGPKLGTYYGYPIYHPNVSNFYKPITPQQYSSFVGLIDTNSMTWNQNVNLTVNNTDVFELPGGSAGFGGLVQVGNQSWQNPTDPRVIAGDFYGLTGTSGGGVRDNWAAAAELRMPFTSMLTADVSARYDQYSNQQGAGGDDKATYKVGLEFRPIDSLLFRGNYATAFRAPDMAYTFGGKSGFYQPGVTDYYRCAAQEPNTPLPDCTYYGSQDPFALHEGSKTLQSITAKSYGFGGVWSPSADFNIKADYYNIKINNEVQIQSIDTLLKTESACRLGQLDINSPTCVAALSQVQRTPADAPNPNALQQVTVFPINIANENVSGILASLAYRYDMGRYGDLVLTSQYNVTLKHTFQQSPGDVTEDYLHNPFFSSEFKNIGNASLTWNIDKFSTTFYGTRYGKTANYYAGTNATGQATPCTTSGYITCPGTVAPWMVYNASVGFSITDDMKISGIVNNIKNSMPPKDYTYTTSPYYNFQNYNAYGRSYWLEFDWKFGRSGK